MLQVRIIKAINMLCLTIEGKNIASFINNKEYNKSYLSQNINFQFTSQHKKPSAG
jgi:hypothetical protein